MNRYRATITTTNGPEDWTIEVEADTQPAAAGIVGDRMTETLKDYPNAEVISVDIEDLGPIEDPDDE